MQRLFRSFDEAGKLIVDLLRCFSIVLCMILSDTGMAQSSVKVTTQSKPILNNTISRRNQELTGSFRITSSFGWRVDPITGRWALHQGADIAGKKGIPILAPTEGLVCKTSQEANLGYLLTIDHGNGYVSSYGHLDSFAVKEGDWVQEGQLIATLGSTGKSSGPHLHYELRYWRQLVNPAIHTMAILQTKEQLDSSLLTGCDKDAADRRPKIVF
jgi:murein DD-endopeptidase MepM/ murein hydrolase activator NlpD